jgi:hypothetical protein
MKNTYSSMGRVFSLVVASAALGITIQTNAVDLSMYATNVYDNSSTYLGQRAPTTGNTYGDEVNLTTTTTFRQLYQFKFEYWLGHEANLNETATVAFYKNDGPEYISGSGILTPGATPFYTTSFSITSGQHTVVIDASPNGLDNSVILPNKFTWTVTFGGIDGSEQVGLLLYNPPTVGTSLDDYWEKVGTTWTLKTFNSSSGGPIANFGAQIVAIPEPSTIALGFIGAAVLGFLARRRS